MYQTRSLNLKPNNSATSCVHTIPGDLKNGNRALETSASLAPPHAPQPHNSEYVVHTLAQSPSAGDKVG